MSNREPDPEKTGVPITEAQSMVRYYLDQSDLANLPRYYHPEDLAKAAAAKHGGAAGLLQSKATAETMAALAELARRNGGRLPSNEAAQDFMTNLVSPGIDIDDASPERILECLKSSQDAMNGNLVLCSENETELPVTCFQTLRFDIGQRVSCLISSTNEWCLGEIVLLGVWKPERGPYKVSGSSRMGEYREPTTYPAYSVLTDDGRTVYVAVDSNQVIKKELSLVEVTKVLNAEFARTANFGIANTKTLVYRAYAGLLRLLQLGQDMGGGMIHVGGDETARVLIPRRMATGVGNQRFGQTEHGGKKYYWGQLKDPYEGPALVTTGDTTLLLWEKDFRYKEGDTSFQLEIPHPSFNDAQTVTDIISIALAVPVAQQKLFQRFIQKQSGGYSPSYFGEEDEEELSESTFFQSLYERINELANTASVFPKAVESAEDKESLLQELSGFLQEKGETVSPDLIRVQPFTALFDTFGQGILLQAFEDDYLATDPGCGMCPVNDVTIKPISAKEKEHHPTCEFMLTFGDPYCG